MFADESQVAESQMADGASERSAAPSAPSAARAPRPHPPPPSESVGVGGYEPHLNPQQGEALVSPEHSERLSVEWFFMSLGIFACGSEAPAAPTAARAPRPHPPPPASPQHFQQLGFSGALIFSHANPGL